MSQRARLFIIALCAAGLLPVTAAQAGWHGGLFGEFHPFEPRAGQPYAVEVAPGTYVIHRPRAQRGYGRETVVVREKPVVITTRRVVDDPARVIVRPHYVDDWRLPHGWHHVESRHRRHWRHWRHKPVTAAKRHRPVRPAAKPAESPAKNPAMTKVETKIEGKGSAYPCVIKADASVTLHGPDRMDISLTRKSGCEALSGAPK